MSRRLAMARLAQVAEEQWGMVTAVQARRLEVSRVDLNRLVADGILGRAWNTSEVYRLAGVPFDPDLEGLRAAWLQLGDSRPASAWLREPMSVVSHRSAAMVLRLGDLPADFHGFYVSKRRQLRRVDLRLRVRSRWTGIHWRVVDGLPVCTAAKVVSDLLAEYEDESAVARICQDALRAQQISWKQLVTIAAVAAKSYGASSGEEMARGLVGAEFPSNTEK